MEPNLRFHRHRKLCGLAGFVTLLYATSLLVFAPNEWRQTQTLNVPAPGLVRVNLPAPTLNAAHPGLEDLRIVDAAGNQVPYLIERPVPNPESMLRPKEFRSTIEAGATRLTLETGTTTPIAGVSLETPASQFVKAVQVEGSHNGANWKKLAAGEPIFQLPGGVAKLRVFDSFAQVIAVARKSCVLAQRPDIGILPERPTPKGIRGCFGLAESNLLAA